MIRKNRRPASGGPRLGSPEGPTAHTWKGFTARFSRSLQKLKHLRNGVRCLVSSPEQPSLAPETLQSLRRERHVLPGAAHTAATNTPAHRSRRAVPAPASPQWVGCARPSRCSHHRGRGTCSFFSGVKGLCTLAMMLVKKE